MKLLLTLPLALVTLATLSGCADVKKYNTTMEITQIEDLVDEKGVKTWSVEMRYADCPGEARRIIRADKGFAACAATKPGTKLKADITATWDNERGSYRTVLTKLGDCTLAADRKEEANFEAVQLCTDIVTTGSIVGVHCDRSRPKEQIDKCPWLRRR